MIRFRRIDLGLLNAWLQSVPLPQAQRDYLVRLWRENPAQRGPVLAELRAYIHEALSDAIGRLRRGFEDDLAPFDCPVFDPAANYPALLHLITLQGYFGEIMAGLAVEHWGARGRLDWNVPAFLFRFHVVEFQHLERINQELRENRPYDPDRDAERRPGRTGDDALAFTMNAENEIDGVIALEAKCLVDHNAGILSNAHEKLSQVKAIPDSIRELIEVLSDYDSPQAAVWQEALLKFRSRGYRTAQRADGLAYLCGNAPQRPRDRTTWFDLNQPTATYTAGRYLEGFEFHIVAVDDLVRLLYRG